MIIYGANPVLEAIRSKPKQVHYVGVSRAQSPRIGKVIAEAKRQGVPVRHLPPEQIDRLAEKGVHNGVIADISEAGYADFEDLAAHPSTSFVFLLDGVTDPHNLGAVLRVADVFGVHLVVVPEHDSAGLTPAAVKASAGAAEWVPVAQVTNLARAIERLKKGGFWVYAAEAGGEPVTSIDLSGKVAVVLGSEGKGIRRNVAEHCDARISIPMSGHVDSLNVSTAAAVIAWEVSRRNNPSLANR
jgi:23S rRNA (guanosine2251-2'-O)-methyltransferase